MRMSSEGRLQSLPHLPEQEFSPHHHRPVAAAVAVVRAVVLPRRVSAALKLTECVLRSTTLRWIHD